MEHNTQSSPSDRELLELAAKAAGAIDDHVSDDNSFGLHLGEEDGMPYVTGNDGWREWNPLTDDGDALRLAVKLHISTYRAPSGKVMAISHDGKTNFSEECPDDPYAATRRAIVRAAAALGKVEGSSHTGEGA